MLNEGNLVRRFAPDLGRQKTSKTRNGLTATDRARKSDTPVSSTPKPGECCHAVSLAPSAAMRFGSWPAGYNSPELVARLAYHAAASAPMATAAATMARTVLADRPV